jgi:hypothetical protein
LSCILPLQFVNTAAIILVLNAYVETGFYLLTLGQFFDFSEEWYTVVGVTITFTMLLYIVLPHFWPAGAYSMKLWRRWRDRSYTSDVTLTKQATQADLNALYLGTEFSVDDRYAAIFNAVFVCLAYSVGIPLMLPILLTTIIVMYWVDKAMFAHVYAKPPVFNEASEGSLASIIYKIT